MTLEDIVNLVDGQVLNGTMQQLSKQIAGGGGAELMSDVLALMQPDMVLLTGLCNPQVVRTAQITDVAAIVFVRGKIPPDETIALAAQLKIPLISSPCCLFEACGRLFQAGLRGPEMPAE